MKNGDILSKKLYVIIDNKASWEPKKYAPLSPRNILALGKLKYKKQEFKIIKILTYFFISK